MATHESIKAGESIWCKGLRLLKNNSKKATMSRTKKSEEEELEMRLEQQAMGT